MMVSVVAFEFGSQKQNLEQGGMALILRNKKPQKVVSVVLLSVLQLNGALDAISMRFQSNTSKFSPTVIKVLISIKIRKMAR